MISVGKWNQSESLLGSELHKKKLMVILMSLFIDLSDRRRLQDWRVQEGELFVVDERKHALMKKVNENLQYEMSRGCRSLAVNTKLQIEKWQRAEVEDFSRMYLYMSDMAFTAQVNVRWDGRFNQDLIAELYEAWARFMYTGIKEEESEEMMELLEEHFILRSESCKHKYDRREKNRRLPFITL